MLCHIVHHLDTKDTATLRLVCTQLAATIKSYIAHASTSQYLTRTAALALQLSFPKLTSLTVRDTVSTFHLHLLTTLTRLEFAPAPDCLGSIVDLAPLEHLPKLHTLRLDQVLLQRLSPVPTCVATALTQLQKLQLVNCSKYDRAPNQAQDLAALSSVTHQVVDHVSKKLSCLGGLQNLSRLSAFAQGPALP